MPKTKTQVRSPTTWSEGTATTPSTDVVADVPGRPAGPRAEHPAADEVELRDGVLEEHLPLRKGGALERLGALLHP